MVCQVCFIFLLQSNVLLIYASNASFRESSKISRPFWIAFWSNLAVSSVAGFFCCQCHGQVYSSVERACEADHSSSFCKCFCDLERVLIALCTGVCEVCFFLVTFTWHNLVQSFCQCYIAIVYIYIENGMKIFFRLFFYCFNDFRMGISDIQYSNTANPVPYLQTWLQIPA